MAKIALRVYNNEISELVDHGQVDEAIAHCRHILGIYPKHVDTYRLLGKAYLEANRYGDAADILQRVLSSVPDDFVSHIGMSIIREDEGNMDAAIYHMERTFEVQPSNNAIQNELRRLYGLRDGVEPAKIRLTRGALARMYAHGNLYDQAVAELHAALSEDPDRLDLQVVLADMYFQLEKAAETADVCTKILNKLPNCIEANRLLHVVLRDQEGREDEADAFKTRWVALDPYAAYIAEGGEKSDHVPDPTVAVDHLDYYPGMYDDESGDQPQWASSLGVSLGDEEQGEEIPDWLANGMDTSDAAGDEEDAPDWFEAPADETSESSLDPFAQPVDDDTVYTEEQPEDVPDWLAAESVGDEAAFAAPAEEEDVPDWLATEAPEEDAVDASAEEDVPDWLVAETPEEDAVEVSAEEDIPDWLAAEEPAAADLVEEEAVPDWLASEAPAAEPAAEAADDDWLAALGGEEEPVAEAADDDWLAALGGEEEPAAEPVAEAADDDWLAALGGEEEPAAEAADDDWLASLGGEEKTAADAEADVIPDFLKEAGWEEGSGADEEAVSFFDEGDDTADAEMELAKADMPDWMKVLEPSEEEKPPVVTDESWLGVATAATAGAEVPDWMKSEDNKAGEEVPDWLSELGPADSEAKTMGEDIPDWLDTGSDDEPTPAGEEITPGSGAEEMPADDAMAWLEGLAAKQGVPDEELVSSPEERAGAADDDWLASLAGEEEEPEAVPAASDEGAMSADDAMSWLDDLASGEISEEDLPGGEEEPMAEPAAEAGDDDWLASLAGEEKEPSAEAADDDWLASLAVEEEEPAAEADDDDWLASLAGEEEEPEAVPAASDEAEMSADDAMSWLDDLASGEISEEDLLGGEEEPMAEPAAEAADDDWLASLAEEEEPAAAPVLPDMSAEEDMSADDAMAWLESLATKQGIPEEELVSSPQERAEVDMASLAAETSAEADDDDWLSALADEEEEPAAEPAAEADDDDWLASLAEEEEPAAAPEAAPVLPDLPAEEEMSADDAMAWLESLAAKQGIPEEELVSSPEARAGALPVEPEPAAEADDDDWLASLAGEEEEPAPAVEADDDDWLSALADEEEPAGEVVAEAVPAAENEDELSADDAMAWLDDLASGDISEDDLLSEEELAAPAQPPDTAILEGLDDYDDEEEFAADLAAGLAAAEAVGSAEVVAAITSDEDDEDEMSADDAMAWLDDLASGEISEDDLLSEEEPAAEQDDEWLTALAEDQQEPAAEDEEDDWLSALSEEPQPEPTRTETLELADADLAEDDEPEWLGALEDVKEPAAAEAPPEPVVEAAAEPEDDSLVPEWLQDIADDETGPDEVGAEPEWLPTIDEPASEWVPESKAVERAPEPSAEKPVVERPAATQAEPAPQPEPVAEKPAVPPPPKPKPQPPVGLASGQAALKSGNIETAITHYEKLIKKGAHVEQVVTDLKEALRRHPVDVGLWQTLGDAYIRLDNLQDALDAYSKAEDLLR